MLWRRDINPSADQIASGPSFSVVAIIIIGHSGDMIIDVGQIDAAAGHGPRNRPKSAPGGPDHHRKLGRRSAFRSLPQYVVFNKPYGVLSQFTDADGHPGLSGFGLPSAIYAAGRLDRDSEGLLLLTDDGPLVNRLLSPAAGHARTYWAQVERLPDAAAIEHLEKGVVIKGRKTRPCQAALIGEPIGLWPRDPPIRFRAEIPDAWIELVLTEGRNRQVRRMTAAIGHPTLRLVRVAIAGLALGREPVGDLAPGQWREVTRADIGVG